MVGPNGEKRPDDPIANAVHIARLATGEAEEQYVDRCRPQARRPGGPGRSAQRGNVAARHSATEDV